MASRTRQLSAARLRSMGGISGSRASDHVAAHFWIYLLQGALEPGQKLAVPGQETWSTMGGRVRITLKASLTADVAPYLRAPISCRPYCSQVKFG
jgi:hypothetical protein